jgi:hypothetical protein
MLMFISGINEAKADTNCSLCTTDWKYKSFNEEVGNDSNNCKSSLIIKYRDCPTNNKEIQIVSMKIDTSCTGFNLVNYVNNAHTFLLKQVFYLFQISNSPTSFDIRIIDSKCINKFGDVIEACDDSCTSNDYTISRYDTTQTGGSVQYTYKISNVIHHHTFGLCIGGSTGCTFTGMMGSPNNTYITQYNNLTETDCAEICYWKLIGNDNVAPTNWLGTKNDVPLVIKTNNVEKMRVSENGKVGIGTSSPFGTLDINCGLWDFNLGKVSITHSATAGHVPQIRLYATLGTVPSPKDEMNYPLVSWFIEHDAGKLNFRSGDEKVLGNEDPKTKVTFLQDGNVGINNTAPTAKLQVTNGTILFDGTTGSTPTSGAGTRMMWIPEKAAFRVGALDDFGDPDYVDFPNFWNNSNIGKYSFAGGINTKAKQGVSFAFGNNVIIVGSSSEVIDGVSHCSVGFGHDIYINEAWDSFAAGHIDTIYGENSMVLGHNNINYSGYSANIGNSTTTGQFAIGANKFQFNYVFGSNLSANANGSMALGVSNSDVLLNSESKSLMIGFDATKPAFFVTGGGDYRINAISPRHNTSQVGIGNSDPTGALSVNTTSVRGVVLGSSWVTTSSPAQNDDGVDLAVQGKVGIGTQKAKGALSVIGTGDDNQVVIWDNESISAPSTVDLMVKQKVLIGQSTLVTTDDYILQVHGSAYKDDGSNSWNVLSDARYKKNINNFSDGLKLLKQINPIWFNYQDTLGLSSKKRSVGILAQEMQKILPYTVNENNISQKIITKASEKKEIIINDTVKISVEDKSNLDSSSGHYKMKDSVEIRYKKRTITIPAEYKEVNTPVLTYNSSALTYVLVNSIKELDELRIKDSINAETKINLVDKKYSDILNSQTYQKQIDSLGTIVANQNAQIKDLQEKYESIKKCCESNNIDLYEDVLLEQNNPNPFDQETKISYFIPERLNAPFTMIILDNKNNTIEQYPLTQNIPTTMTIFSKNYITGVYTYSILDGTRNIIKSKKMMIIK